MDISYLKAALGKIPMNRVDNTEVNKIFEMVDGAYGMNFRVVELVRRTTLRWYGHERRIYQNRLVKREFSKVERRVC